MVDYGLGLRRTRRSRLRSSKIVLYSKLSRYALIGLILMVFLSVGIFLWYGRDLPQPGKLAEASLGNSTRIYDRNGEILYSVYKNDGFSVTGLVRGLVIDPILRRRVTGGSTITLQLIKNVLLTSERSLPRKVKELILAVQADKIYSKDEILEMYLNNVPYGGTAIGIDSASEAYFGKGVEELDLAQSAFLAGLPQAPSSILHSQATTIT